MPVLFMGAGLVAGFLAAVLLEDGWFELAVGVTFGWLLLRQRRLAARIARLEGRHAPANEEALGPAPVQGTLVAPPAAAPHERPPQELAPLDAPPSPGDVPPSAGTPPPGAAHPPSASPPPAGAPLPIPPPPLLPAWRGAEVVKRWLLQGNLPVKVGMLVLFAGVTAFLKYASDEGWLSAPIEVRLGAVALVAMGALVFGFRERERRRGFSLGLQGGAIGILHLTVFVALRLYDLLPQGMAFALLICLVAGTGVLAVVQNAPSLAVLATLAGFLAPILVSTGGGSHVALFSWYAILNLLVVSVAWWKRWRILDSLAFVLTTGFMGAWAATSYEPGHLFSVQAFATLFYVYFVCLSLLNARKTEGFEAAVSSLLVFGNPIFFLGMQGLMLYETPLILAFAVLAVAVGYVSLAAVLRHGEEVRTLRDAFAVLAIAAATLAVPLAFSAEITTGIFALEGAALVWLGFRQGRLFPLASGVGLQAIAGLVFLGGLGTGVSGFGSAAFISGLWVVAAGALSAWLSWREGRRMLAAGAAVWTLLLWSLGWVVEIFSSVPSWSQPEAFLLWAVATSWLLSEAYERASEPFVAWAASIWMGWAFLFALAQIQEEPFAGWGALVWLVFLLVGVRAISRMRQAQTPPLALVHLAFLWAMKVGAMGLGLQLAGLLDLGDGWGMVAVALPILLGFGAMLLGAGWISVPLSERFSSYRDAALALPGAVLAAWFLVSLGEPGGAGPLPYLPLLNPMDLATAAGVVMGAWWLADEDAPAWLARSRLPLVAALGFIALTASTFRAVHWLGGLPWDGDLVSRMELQASLTVVWSVVGVVSWVMGSKRGSRPLWLVGAGLMSLVLVKLGVVDRAHLGNLAGIVSFLAFGVLCTVVGYLAPAPPRDETRLST